MKERIKRNAWLIISFGTVTGFILGPAMDPLSTKTLTLIIGIPFALAWGFTIYGATRFAAYIYERIEDGTWTKGN